MPAAKLNETVYATQAKDYVEIMTEVKEHGYGLSFPIDTIRGGYCLNKIRTSKVTLIFNVTPGAIL